MYIRPPAGPFPELLYNIRAYFENSCQAIRLDDHGVFLTPNGAKWHNDLCSAFDSYCFTATMLKKREMYIEFRRAVYKATILFERILQDEQPRTLVCFFEVLIHLIHNGQFEVASCLRRYIKCMSATFIEEGNPWGQICWLLGELDSESLNSAMAEAWKCTTDTFDSRLGCTSPLAVSVRLDYIKRIYETQDYGREESLLRELFNKLGTLHLSTPRVILNLAHNLNRQKLHEKAREMALTVFALVQGHKMYAGKVVEKIEAVKIVSHCFFNEGQIANAEQT